MHFDMEDKYLDFDMEESWEEILMLKTPKLRKINFALYLFVRDSELILH